MLKGTLTILFVCSFALQWRHPELSFHNGCLGLIVNMIWLWG